MKSKTREWLRKNMRARWPLVNLFICIVFACIMFLIEDVGRSGGWWPDGFLRQFLLSPSAGAVIVLMLGAVVLIVRRVGGRAI